MAHNFVHLPNDQTPPRHETHERIFPPRAQSFVLTGLTPGIWQQTHEVAATRHHQRRFFNPGSGINAITVFVAECSSGSGDQENSGVYLMLPTLSEKVPKSAGCWHLNISHLRSEIVFQEISWRLAVIPLHLSCFRIFNKSFRQSSINVKPRSCVCSCSV